MKRIMITVFIFLIITKIMISSAIYYIRQTFETWVDGLVSILLLLNTNTCDLNTFAILQLEVTI